MPWINGIGGLTMLWINDALAQSSGSNTVGRACCLVAVPHGCVMLPPAPLLMVTYIAEMDEAHMRRPTATYTRAVVGGELADPQAHAYGHGCCASSAGGWQSVGVHRAVSSQ